MTVLTGQEFYLEFDGVEIKSLYREFEDGMEQESAEATAGNDAVRNYVPTIMKIEPKGKFVLNEGSAALAKLKLGTSGTLIWGPQGNSAGEPKWGVACRIKSVPVKRKYDGEVELDVSWEPTSGTLAFDGRTATF